MTFFVLSYPKNAAHCIVGGCTEHVTRKYHNSKDCREEHCWYSVIPKVPLAAVLLLQYSAFLALCCPKSAAHCSQRHFWDKRVPKNAHFQNLCILYVKSSTRIDHYRSTCRYIVRHFGTLLYQKCRQLQRGAFLG